MMKNWHERTIDNITIIYHDGVSPLVVLNSKNNLNYFKFAKYGVEVIQITPTGLIILRKNNLMGAINFDGKQVLPFKYRSIFSTCSGVKVKYEFDSDWKLADL